MKGERLKWQTRKSEASVRIRLAGALHTRTANIVVNTARTRAMRLTAAAVTRNAVDLIIRNVSIPHKW
jgi:hypothetical protein